MTTVTAPNHSGSGGAYAYSEASHAAAIGRTVKYAVVNDIAGHFYTFAANHFAVELNGLVAGLSGLAAGQILGA